MAAVDYFLKIDGIQGESTDAKHKNEIELESFSWGATNAPAHGGAGKLAGRVAMQDFHFTMLINKASPKLFLACASGEHIKHATLVARRAGKHQQEYLVYKFTDVLVSSYQTGASGDFLPTDQISLNFGRIEFEYRPQQAGGGLGSGVKAGWDVRQNKAV
jgi:type VI secretion system secreted protein Hcp